MIYGLKEFAEHGAGWAPAAAILAGSVLGVVFLRRQRTLAHPLVDLGLFRSPAFSTALVTYTLALFVAFGAFIFVAQYLQMVLGLSPLESRALDAARGRSGSSSARSSRRPWRAGSGPRR